MNNSHKQLQQANKESLNDINKGEIIESKNIRFEDVPIFTPNGDCLIEKMNIEVYYTFKNFVFKPYNRSNLV